jgi:hypothetical protein
MKEIAEREREREKNPSRQAAGRFIGLGNSGINNSKDSEI